MFLLITPMQECCTNHNSPSACRKYG